MVVQSWANQILDKFEDTSFRWEHKAKYHLSNHHWNLLELFDFQFWIWSIQEDSFFACCHCSILLILINFMRKLIFLLLIILTNFNIENRIINPVWNFNYLWIKINRIKNYYNQWFDWQSQKMSKNQDNYVTKWQIFNDLYIINFHLSCWLET